VVFLSEGRGFFESVKLKALKVRPRRTGLTYRSDGWHERGWWPIWNGGRVLVNGDQREGIWTRNDQGEKRRECSRVGTHDSILGARHEKRKSRVN